LVEETGKKLSEKNKMNGLTKETKLEVYVFFFFSYFCEGVGKPSPTSGMPPIVLGISEKPGWPSFENSTSPIPKMWNPYVEVATNKLF
jgi:hypothetical protein